MLSESLFLCTVGVERVLDSGVSKKMNEKYLVNALTPSEAEAILCQELGPDASGEFEVKNINKEKVSEIFTCEGDKWYKASVNYITTDEKTGAEKKSKSVMYLRSSNFESAFSDLLQSMKGTVSDFEYSSLVETQVLDLLPTTSD